jgi:hypothetical protein
VARQPRPDVPDDLVSALERGDAVGDVAFVAVEAPCELDTPIVEGDVTRFGTDSDATALTVTPALADRPVITRPEKPFYVRAGDEVTVFVSTPVWLQLHVENAQLHEFAILRPSDTWFGPNTRSGELCYASRSYCRLRVEDLLPTPHRARTPVIIQNHADDPLLVQRMNIPVHYLSLFEDEGGGLWTESMILERRAGQELSAMQLRPTRQVPLDLSPLSTPRVAPTDNLMVRAFSDLLGLISG